MSVPLRVVTTVRRLVDDGEQPSTIRTVGGFRIETGVPIPPVKGALKGRLTRALDALAVGESLVKTGGQHAINPRTRRALLPKEYTGRKLATGFRIWRTK